MNELVVNELAGLAVTINQEDKLAREAASKAVQHAIACGEMLARVKELCVHGTFISWVSENTQVSERSARRYMAAFDKYSNDVEALTEGVTVKELAGEPKRDHVAEGAKRNRAKTAPAGAVLPSVDVAAIEQAAREAVAAELAQANADADLATKTAEEAERDKRIAQAQAKKLAAELLAAQTAPPKVSPLQAQLDKVLKEFEETKVILEKHKVAIKNSSEANVNLRKNLRATAAELEELKGIKKPAPVVVKKDDPREWLCKYVRQCNAPNVLTLLEAVRRIEHPDKGGSSELTAQLNVIIGEFK